MFLIRNLLCHTKNPDTQLSVFSTNNDNQWDTLQIELNSESKKNTFKLLIDYLNVIANEGIIINKDQQYPLIQNLTYASFGVKYISIEKVQKFVEKLIESKIELELIMQICEAAVNDKATINVYNDNTLDILNKLGYDITDSSGIDLVTNCLNGRAINNQLFEIALQTMHNEDNQHINLISLSLPVIISPQKSLFNNLIFIQCKFYGEADDTKFNSCIFINSQFENIKSKKSISFNNSVLNQCSFNNAKFSSNIVDIDFSNCTSITNSDFGIYNAQKSTNLKNINFNNLSLNMTRFFKCKFENVTFDGAILEYGSFRNCDLSNIKCLPTLVNSILHNVDLSNLTVRLDCNTLSEMDEITINENTKFDLIISVNIDYEDKSLCDEILSRILLLPNYNVVSSLLQQFTNILNIASDSDDDLKENIALNMFEFLFQNRDTPHFEILYNCISGLTTINNMNIITALLKGQELTHAQYIDNIAWITFNSSIYIKHSDFWIKLENICNSNFYITTDKSIIFETNDQQIIDIFKIINPNEGSYKNNNGIFLLHETSREISTIKKLYDLGDGTYSTDKNSKYKYNISQSGALVAFSNITPSVANNLHLYSKLDSQTTEYSGFNGIKNHHEEVIINFISYFANDFEDLTGVPSDFMTLIFSLHDIGKGIGTKDLQHLNSKAIIKKHQKEVGLDPIRAKMVSDIVSQDPIGEWMQGQIEQDDAILILENSFQKFSNRAKQHWNKNINREQYFDLMSIYYKCDLGSYPTLLDRYFIDRQLNNPTDFFTAKINKLKDKFLTATPIDNNIRIYNDPSLLIRNFAQFIKKFPHDNKEKIVIIDTHHKELYQAVNGYLDEITSICNDNEILILECDDEHMLDLEDKIIVARFSTNLTFNNIISQKIERVYLGIQTTHAKIKTIVPPKSQDEMEAKIKYKQNQFLKLTDDHVVSDINDNILNDYRDRGILISNQNLDFLEKLQNLGNQALFDKGDLTKPWNLLSTSVLIEKSAELVFCSNINSINICAIFDPELVEFSFAWSQSPLGVNKAHSQSTNLKTIESDGQVKERLYTDHSNNVGGARDLVYDKNGLIPIADGRSQMIISRIANKKLKEALKVNIKTSEQKISLQPNAIRGLFIYSTNANIQGNNSETILQEQLRMPQIQRAINMIKGSSLNNLPIYLYLNNYKNTAFLKIPEHSY